MYTTVGHLIVPTGRIRRLTAVVLGTMAVAAPAASAQTVFGYPPLDGIGATSAQAAAAQPTGQILGGFTSQGLPVVLQPATNQQSIARAGIALSMSCTSGTQFDLGDWWLRVPISPRGAVKVALQLPASTSSGTTVSGSDSLTGKFDRRRLTFTGAWRFKLTITDTTTGKSDKCDSGRATFTARL